MRSHSSSTLPRRSSQPTAPLLLSHLPPPLRPHPPAYLIHTFLRILRFQRHIAPPALTIPTGSPPSATRRSRCTQPTVLHPRLAAAGNGPTGSPARSTPVAQFFIATSPRLLLRVAPPSPQTNSPDCLRVDTPRQLIQLPRQLLGIDQHRVAIVVLRFARHRASARS